MTGKELSERLHAISAVLDGGDLNHAQSLLHNLRLDVLREVDGHLQTRITVHIGDRLSAVAADLGFELAGMLTKEDKP